MNNSEQRNNIDAIITFVFLKKLLTPFVRTPAHKLGLIDTAGKVIKEPSTDEERMALTLLDRVIFKLRRLLGSKILIFQSFLYTLSMGGEGSMYSKLIIRGSVMQRAELQKIERDMKMKLENVGISFENYLEYLVEKEVEKKEILNG